MGTGKAAILRRAVALVVGRAAALVVGGNGQGYSVLGPGIDGGQSYNSRVVPRVPTPCKGRAYSPQQQQ